MNDRLKELLLSTADALQRGSAPLNDAWLRENAVTPDEVAALAENMATAIRAYARAGCGLSAAMIALSVAEDEEQGRMLASHVLHNDLMGECAKRLNRLPPQGGRKGEHP